MAIFGPTSLLPAAPGSMLTSIHFQFTIKNLIMKLRSEISQGYFTSLYKHLLIYLKYIHVERQREKNKLTIIMMSMNWYHLKFHLSCN